MIIAALGVAIFTGILCIFSIWTRTKRKTWEGEKVVHLPFYLAVIGMVCGGILCVPTIVCALDGEWMFAFFGAVVLVCDSMMAAYLNCVIWYDDKGFLTRNFFGVKRECLFSEVEGIRTGKDRRIFFHGHSVLIDEISCGGDAFIEAVDRGHKRMTGRWVPASTSFKRKWDPMNGHIDYPWFYFSLWVFLGLICVATPIMIAVSMTGETDPADVTMYRVTFTEYEVDGSELHLYAEGEDVPFIIDYYQNYGDVLPSPEQLCDGHTYLVGTTGKGQYVKYLSDESGGEYITYETERQVYRDSQRGASLFLGIFSLLGVAFCYYGIAVARNPERYSDRFRRLFYKDGYLH